MIQWHAYLVVGAFVGSAIVTWTTRGIARRRQLLDRPNERSAHVRPTPRLGGVGIVLAFLVAAGVVLARTGAGVGAIAVIAATAAIAAVGLVDDLKPLPARVRFGAQLLAAAAVVGLNLPRVPDAWVLAPVPTWILVPASVLWIVWLTNLYNFMDGIDGLAGGQAVIAGAAIASAAFAMGSPAQGTLALALAASSAGFLMFNAPPASIFMGDVGSTAIGFFLAALPFVPGGAGVPVEAVGIALALFILDATTTLARRIARGERFFQAHRTHLYQRPLALGLSHAVITTAVVPGMVAVGAAAVLFCTSTTSTRAGLVIAPAVVFLTYAAAVLRLERRSTETSRTAPRAN